MADGSPQLWRSPTTTLWHIDAVPGVGAAHPIRSIRTTLPRASLCYALPGCLLVSSCVGPCCNDQLSQIGSHRPNLRQDLYVIMATEVLTRTPRHKSEALDAPTDPWCPRKTQISRFRITD